MNGEYNDALSQTVRDALLYVTRLKPLDELELDRELPDGELESVIAGKSAASTDVGYAVANALGCMAMDIEVYEDLKAYEMEIHEALADPGDVASENREVMFADPDELPF